MKKYQFLILLVVIFASNIITAFTIDRYFIPKVKTISLLEIINDKEDKYYKQFLDGKISKDEYSEKLDQKMEAIQEAISQISNGKDLLIAEEAVIKSDKNNYTSLTEAVKNYVEQYQNSVKK